MAVLRAKQAFSYTVRKGVPRVVKPGDLFDSSDPCVKGREKLFEPVESAVARRTGVEEATAEPGGRRSVSVRRSRKPADEGDKPEGDAGTNP